MTKSCKTCGECARLYRKAWCEFVATHEYFCRIRGELTSPADLCECWRQSLPVYDLSPERFEFVKNDLKLIKKFGETL